MVRVALPHFAYPQWRTVVKIRFILCILAVSIPTCFLSQVYILNLSAGRSRYTSTFPSGALLTGFLALSSPSNCALTDLLIIPYVGPTVLFQIRTRSPPSTRQACLALGAKYLADPSLAPFSPKLLFIDLPWHGPHRIVTFFILLICETPNRLPTASRGPLLIPWVISMRSSEEKSRLQADVGAVADKRRCLARYSLQLPVVFSWRNRDGLLRQGHGHTRDLSSWNEFIVSMSPPEKDALVHLEIFLPRITAAVRELRILAEGTVARVESVEHDPADRGFAVVNFRSVLSDRPVPISLKQGWAPDSVSSAEVR